MAIYMMREYIPYQYQPTANTLIYLPFVEDYDNQGTGGYLKTDGYYAPTFVEKEGVNCAYFKDNSFLITNSSLNLTNYYTVSMWIYCDTANGGNAVSANRLAISLKDSSTIGMAVLSGQYGTGSWIYTSSELNKWIYVLGINNYGTYTLSVFIDGVENKVSFSGSTYSNTYQFGINGGGNKFYMSDLIVENKPRTDDFKTEYYNGIKLKYGIN